MTPKRKEEATKSPGPSIPTRFSKAENLLTTRPLVTQIPMTQHDLIIDSQDVTDKFNTVARLVIRNGDKTATIFVSLRNDRNGIEAQLEATQPTGNPKYGYATAKYREVVLAKLAQ